MRGTKTTLTLVLVLSLVTIVNTEDGLTRKVVAVKEPLALVTFIVGTLIRYRGENLCPRVTRSKLVKELVAGRVEGHT
jgi:hypothetical protein